MMEAVTIEMVMMERVMIEMVNWISVERINQIFSD